MSTQLRNRILVAFGLVILFATVATVWFVVTRNSSIDKPSGEEVSSPSDKTPETYGVYEHEITYYGIATLTKAGVSKFKVSSFRKYIQLYSDEHSNAIKTVSVYHDSINQKSTESNDITMFTIKINNKQDALVKFTSVGILDVNIVVIDKGSNKILFETGVLKDNVENNQDFTGDGAPPEEQ